MLNVGDENLCQNSKSCIYKIKYISLVISADIEDIYLQGLLNSFRFAWQLEIPVIWINSRFSVSCH